MEQSIKCTNDPPSIPRAWEAFKAHTSIFACIYIAALALTIIDYLITFIVSNFFYYSINGSQFLILNADLFGFLFSLPVTIVNSLVGILIVAVPAVYFSSGEVLTIGKLLSIIRVRFWRFILAGIFWSIALVFGYLFCIIPGLILSIITPIYVNKIFTTDLSILQASEASWQAFFKSDNAISFLGISLFVAVLALAFTISTCFLGVVIAAPMSCFYLQHYAYYKGILR